jgi:hypothetical protein
MGRARDFATMTNLSEPPEAARPALPHRLLRETARRRRPIETRKFALALPDGGIVSGHMSTPKRVTLPSSQHGCG